MKKHNIVYMPEFIKQTFIFLVLLFFVDNLVVMREEIVDISENTSINQLIKQIIGLLLLFYYQSRVHYC